MTPKRPLAVGDRVAVYWTDGRYTGEIIGIETHPGLEPNVLRVKWDDGDKPKLVHPRQCVRLKVKPKKPVEYSRARWGWWKDRVECWGVVRVGLGLEHNQVFNTPDGHGLEPNTVNPLDRVAHLVELRPGEVPIDRERLAEAWDIVSAKNHGVSTCFNHLAEALGLPEDTK